MFDYVCSMWNLQAILQWRGANLEIQDGVQVVRRTLFVMTKHSVKSSFIINNDWERLCMGIISTFT